MGFNEKTYDAYYEQLEGEQSSKTRNRVHWVIANTIGENVLEIDSNQGLIPILLGREGYQICGIHTSEKEIETAKANLQKEDHFTKENVSFKHIPLHKMNNFEFYDTVILDGVLNRVFEVEKVIKQALFLLKEDGVLIVTAPFGFDDSIDTKHTYYVKDFLDFQNFGAGIQKIEFSGDWVGIVYSKKQQPKAFDENLLAQLEDEFYNLELTKTQTFRHTVNDTDLKVKEEQIIRLKEELVNEYNVKN